MRNILLAAFIILAILLTGCSPSAATNAPSGAVVPTTAVVPVTGNEAKVTISGFAFGPASITVKTGQTVTWTNQDNAAHTVVADDNSWASPNIAKGESYTHTFTSAGTFTYHCSIHPTMKATVVVSP
jgi:plastocyanin